MPTITSVSTVPRTYVRGGATIESSIQRRSEHSKVWTRTPGYRALKASGAKLPDNPFYYKKGAGYGGGANFGNGYAVYSEGYYIYPKFLPVEDSVYEPVRARLIERAKGQNWNVPVFVAEGRKTAQMVYDRATHLAKMVFELRRGRIDKFAAMFHDSVSTPGRRRRNRWKSDFGKDAQRAQANIWLEAQYGWVPFMLDVQSAVNTVMDAVETPAKRMGTIRTSLTRNRIYTGEERLNYSDPVYAIQGWTTPIVHDKQSVRAVWRFSPRMADLPGRFGLLNPLEVIWELVPLSFVADWFLPIGDYLSALDASSRFTHEGGTWGQRREIVMDYKMTRHGLTPPSKGSGKAMTTSLYIARDPMASLPTPTLAGLAFQPKLGIARTISGIALLSQQLSRLGKR